MKKNILWLLCLGGFLMSCDTKQNWIDTGVASPYHEGSIMEYLRSDKYNWELTVEMIEHAGLEDLFDGKVDTLPQITFFAPPSFTILRYLWDNKLEKVAELQRETCREILLKHVVRGKYLKKDIAFRNQKYSITSPLQDGGTDLICLGKNHLKAYVDKSSYAEVPDVGPQTMFLYSFSADTRVPLASPDIQPKNGVVHALNYNYILGKI